MDAMSPTGSRPAHPFQRFLQNPVHDPTARFGKSTLSKMTGIRALVVATT